jgi:hypothetical protein
MDDPYRRQGSVTGGQEFGLGADLNHAVALQDNIEFVQPAPDFVGPIKKGPAPPIALNPNRHSPHRPNRPQICLAVFPGRSDQCDDRNPVKEKLNERERNR